MQVPFFHRAVWANAVILGLISPLVNSFYNFQGRVNGTNDVADLLEALPDPVVYAYFWATMLFYVVGIWTVFRRSEMAKFTRPSGRLSLEIEGRVGKDL